MGKGASSEGRERIAWARREVLRVVLRLIDDYWLYFDKQETLNSDGVRLLATALRYSRYLDEPSRLKLKEALKRRSAESIRSLAEELGIINAGELLKGAEQGLEGVKL